MRKQQPTSQSDLQIIYKKNRGKLIEQNRQLYSQIFRLQSKVNILLTKNIANDFKSTVQQEKFNQHHKQQTKDQVAQIQKLKKKILLLKNSSKPQQKQDMKQVLNQLTYLKKQKQKYLYQKQALTKKRAFKDQNLQLNKPIEQQRKSILASYKAVQRQNFEHRIKITNAQRQTINLHKIKQLAKTSVSRISNHDTQISKLQQLIAKTKNDIKSIETQWQPRVDSLNTQYFILKEIKEEKQIEIQNLQKIIANCENRMSGMRQEDEIMEDKNRISKIVISPQKREQISLIYQAQKQKQQFFQQFRSVSKNQFVKISPKQFKSNQNMNKNNSSSHQNKASLQSTKQMQKPSPQQRKSQKISIENVQAKNEFSQLEDDLGQSTKKQNKIFASVAVGTTFFYKEDSQSDQKS